MSARISKPLLAVAFTVSFAFTAGQMPASAADPAPAQACSGNIYYDLFSNCVGPAAESTGNDSTQVGSESSDSSANTGAPAAADPDANHYDGAGNAAPNASPRVTPEDGGPRPASTGRGPSAGASNSLSALNNTLSNGLLGTGSTGTGTPSGFGGGGSGGGSLINICLHDCKQGPGSLVNLCLTNCDGALER
jgi:hypothetical protein